MGLVRHALAALAVYASAYAVAADATLVAFDAPAPYADRAVIAERMLHRFQFERARAHAVDAGRPFAGAALDPRAERWELIAPDDCRAEAPCGVLVWVHPWDDARAPRDWARVLRAARVIYVGALRSGNDRPVLDRRVPLALHGLAGVRARYATDPARTWIGGFSGGGRVASRLAIAYPDQFAGGIFVATSDGPGTGDAPLPAEPLLAALRRGRYWLSVGDADPENHSISRDAAKHFRRVCALDATLVLQTGWGHRTLDGRRLGHALRHLDAASAIASADRARCEAAASAEADNALAEVRALLAAGDRAAARRALLDAHRAWGGLISAAFAELLPQVDDGGATR
jgi:pimeloyl-ACP methyl ester carboxylesterase